MEIIALALIVLAGWAVIDWACAAMSSRIDREEEDK